MPHRVGNKLIQKVYNTFYQRYSVGPGMCVTHADLSPVNMLIAQDKNRVTKIIDYDSVTICDESFALFQMLKLCPKNQRNEMIGYYSDITHHTLQYKKIQSLLNVYDMTSECRKKLNAMMSNKRSR